MPFLSRRTQVPEVNQGALFHRRRDHEIVETANVIAVTPDAAGIIHVQFNLRISGPRTVDEEQRTLSLEYFHRLYREAVAV
ncbi:MAG TPA: hypothetical protein VH722_01160 [Alphaproteobacteria bacterium]|nr:hypothetical protein [Alphaproteobacteria bacterium]